MKRLAVLAIGLLLAPLDGWAEGRPTFESLWLQANAPPGHQTIERDDAIEVDVPSENAIYYFTKPGLRIHPGVVKRMVIETQSGIEIKTLGWSFGPPSAQPEFRRWLDDFKAQDEAIRKKFQLPANGGQ